MASPCMPKDVEIRRLDSRQLTGFRDWFFLVVAHPGLIIVFQKYQRVAWPILDDRSKEGRALVGQYDVPGLIAFGLPNGNGPAVRVEIVHRERAQFAIARPGFQGTA